MTTSRQNQSAMRLVRRHPRMAGLALAIIGALMAVQSLREARSISAFVRGTTVQGRVVAIENVGRVTPDYRMHAAWTDSEGVERTGTARAYKRDARKLRAGDAVDLRIAPGGDAVMQQRLYRSAGLMSLGPVVATPMAIVGALLALAGVFLVATGGAFLRAPD